ncbi:hypothetical protein AAG570_004437 [Ranatra chinensis]|uniref:Uncharacterized protein n=1 Tax=Ranatra chinensis TaxID=642074 RepID=A0ABD0YJ23_9HEMI
MASKRRNMFYEYKKQETTEIVVEYIGISELKLEMEKDFEVRQLKSELTKDREKQIEEIRKLREELSDRDLQLANLSDMVKRQCSHMEEEVMVLRKEINNSVTNDTNADLKQKIAFLKKKIIKLEKRNEKMAKEYEKRLRQSYKDYDFKIQSLQLEMGGRKSEVPGDVETAMNSLECRYKSLLTEIDYRYFLQKQFDLKVKCVFKLKAGLVTLKNATLKMTLLVAISYLW